MKELDQAIAKCRDDIGVLAARLVQLEEARELVAGVLGERPVKPPPACGEGGEGAGRAG